MHILAQLLKKHDLLTLTALAVSGLAAAVTLGWNLLLGDIINIISKGKNVSPDVIVGAVVIMLVLCAANYIKTYVTGLTCEILIHDLRMGYARYFSSLPLSQMERLNTGEQLSKLQNEISDVSGYISGNLFQLVNDGITFLFSFAWLLILNVRLTLAVNLPVIAIMIYVFYTSRIISNAALRSQQAKGRMNKYADTLLTLFPIIRLYDAADMILVKYNREVLKWEQQTVKVEKLRARLMSLSGLLSSIPLMLMLFIGGGMVMEGTLALGTLYVFLNLSGNVSGVMMNMPGIIASFRQFSVHMKLLSPKILLDGREGRHENSYR